MSYRTVRGRADHEDEVAGSRFLATVVPVDGPEDAQALLETLRAEHPDASHHCWAYRVGRVQRFSDDGEPGGTAGRPMLEVFLKRDLDHVAAVVVRYFGGRKLGAGGLVRAYGAAVARAVRRAGEREVVATVDLHVEVPFSDLDAVLRELDGWPSVRRGEPAFVPEGAQLLLEVPLPQVDDLQDRLARLTRGRANCRRQVAGGAAEGTPGDHGDPDG